jgi:hypothetical protein
MQWLDTTFQQKMGSPPNLLGSVCPNEFRLFLNYTRNLCFNEKSDYASLHKIFHDLLMHEGYQSDHPFAWHMISNTPDPQGADARESTISKMFHRGKTQDNPATRSMFLVYPKLQFILSFCRLYTCTCSLTPTTSTLDTAY